MKPLLSKNLPPVVALTVLVLFCLAGLLIGNVISLALLPSLFNLPLAQVPMVFTNPDAYPQARPAILFYQALVAAFAFIGGPLLLLLLSGNKLTRFAGFSRPVPHTVWLLVPLVVIFFMPLNSLAIDWNNTIDLPDLFGFEAWARAQEENLKKLTEFITDFSTPLQFLGGVVAIAVLPGFGEELTFRGVAQYHFRRWFGNPHVAIWVTAVLFSAIHVQFLGFVPRMFIGALLGYLYLWSGNLWVPVLGHFANNGFTVLMMYLRKLGLVSFQIDSTEPMPLGVVAISGVLFAACLYALYTLLSKRQAKT